MTSVGLREFHPFEAAGRRFLLPGAERGGIRARRLFVGGRSICSLTVRGRSTS